MNIKTITLTGADENTSFVDLRALVDAYSSVEVGLLYTCNPQGRGRYPSRWWIEMAAHVLSGRVALHVCGKQARQQLLDGELGAIVRHTPRVQVNGYLTIDEVHKLCSVVSTLITQHNEHNAHLLGATAPNHSLLVDASGGRGLSPEKWVAPRTDKKVGYAGGLGMKNLVHEYPRIAAVAHQVRGLAWRAAYALKAISLTSQWPSIAQRSMHPFVRDMPWPTFIMTA